MRRKSLKKGGIDYVKAPSREEEEVEINEGPYDPREKIDFSRLYEEHEEPREEVEEEVEEVIAEPFDKKKFRLRQNDYDETPIQRHLPEEVRSRAIKLRMDKIQKNMNLDQEYEDLTNELRRMLTEYVPMKDGKSANQQMIDIRRRMGEIAKLRQKNSEETRVKNEQREENIQSLTTTLIRLGENYSRAAPKDREAIRDKIENIKRSLRVLESQGGKSKKRKTRKGRRSNRRRSNKRR